MGLKKKEEFKDKQPMNGSRLEVAFLSVNKKQKKLVEPWLEPGYLEIKRISFDKDNNQLLVEFINLDLIELDLNIFEPLKRIQAVELGSENVLIYHITEDSDFLCTILTGPTIRESTSQEYLAVP